MIQFALKCDQNHQFHSWFQSAAAYDKLHLAGMIACAHCGSTSVVKSIMAPRVTTSRTKSAAPAPDHQPDTAPARPLSTPTTATELALGKLKQEIEANSDYVGPDFATQARAIHDGTAPARSIYGEARLDEARALIKDGVPVMPLPFLPGRKSN
jgi:hypothetical protein